MMRKSVRSQPSAMERAGFTLIELVVVVGVLAILAAITTSAVQAARESARRMQCSNNLKQIALALQGYVAESGTFPPIDCPSSLLGVKVMPSAHYYSFLSRMLHLTEQVPLYNSVDFYFVPDSAEGLLANQTAMMTVVGTFLCPPDSGSTVYGYGRVNYHCNVGVTYEFSPSPSDPNSNSGAFTTHVAYRPSDFTDGLSNTIGASERLQGDWLTGPFKQGGDYFLSPFGSSPINVSPDGAVALCQSVPPGFAVESRSGESWFVSGFHFTNYNHLLAPNSRDLQCAFDDLTEPFHSRIIHNGVFAATSFHSGGVNAAAMDGSVRFITDGVQISLWRAVGTRNGNEVISTPGSTF
jgi:prepilin-type N-terminal cleavage/methylation domain-containing protein/prepilin-type processing-associated H-X9-DG protein